MESTPDAVAVVFAVALWALLERTRAFEEALGEHFLGLVIAGASERDKVGPGAPGRLEEAIQRRLRWLAAEDQGSRDALGLDEALAGMKAEGGDVVFLDPTNGELLALASRQASSRGR